MKKKSKEEVRNGDQLETLSDKREAKSDEKESNNKDTTTSEEKTVHIVTKQGEGADTTDNTGSKAGSQEEEDSDTKPSKDGMRRCVNCRAFESREMPHQDVTVKERTVLVCNPCGKYLKKNRRLDRNRCYDCFVSKPPSILNPSKFILCRGCSSRCAAVTLDGAPAYATDEGEDGHDGEDFDYDNEEDDDDADDDDDDDDIPLASLTPGKHHKHDKDFDGKHKGKAKYDGVYRCGHCHYSGPTSRWTEWKDEEGKLLVICNACNQHRKRRGTLKDRYCRSCGNRYMQKYKRGPGGTLVCQACNLDDVNASVLERITGQQGDAENDGEGGDAGNASDSPNSLKTWKKVLKERTEEARRKILRASQEANKDRTSTKRRSGAMSSTPPSTISQNQQRGNPSNTSSKRMAPMRPNDRMSPWQGYGMGYNVGPSPYNQALPPSHMQQQQPSWQGQQPVQGIQPPPPPMHQQQMPMQGYQQQQPGLYQQGPPPPYNQPVGNYGYLPPPNQGYQGQHSYMQGGPPPRGPHGQFYGNPPMMPPLQQQGGYHGMMHAPPQQGYDGNMMSGPYDPQMGMMDQARVYQPMPQHPGQQYNVPPRGYHMPQQMPQQMPPTAGGYPMPSSPYPVSGPMGGGVPRNEHAGPGPQGQYGGHRPNYY